MLDTTDTDAHLFCTVTRARRASETRTINIPDVCFVMVLSGVMLKEMTSDLWGCSSDPKGKPSAEYFAEIDCQFLQLSNERKLETLAAWV